MRVSAWNDRKKTYGLRIGTHNQKEFFCPGWDKIVVEIVGQPHCIKLTNAFWKGCPEIQDPVLRKWLARHCSLAWPKGIPPHAELLPLGGNQFRLLP